MSPERIDAARRLTLHLGSRCRLGEVREELQMSRWHPMVLFFAVAGGSSGQQVKRGEMSADNAMAEITFQVHGMMKAKSGAT